MARRVRGAVRSGAASIGNAVTPGGGSQVNAQGIILIGIGVFAAALAWQGTWGEVWAALTGGAGGDDDEEPQLPGEDRPKRGREGEDEDGDEEAPDPNASEENPRGGRPPVGSRDPRPDRSDVPAAGAGPGRVWSVKANGAIAAVNGASVPWL